MMMLKDMRTVSNPLTLIAIFAGLAEIAGTVALPTLPEVIQSKFVWFVMLFPVLLVTFFFATLNWNAKVIYAPSDYRNEENFMRSVHGGDYGPASPTESQRIMDWLNKDLTTHTRDMESWLQRLEPPVSLNPAFWVIDSRTPTELLTRAINDLRISWSWPRPTTPMPSPYRNSVTCR